MLPATRSFALALTLASAAAAQSPRGEPADSGFQFRVGGDVEVPAGDREGGVVVVRGTARVAGAVGVLIVLDGNAAIVGGRVGELIVVRGRARLEDSAVVTGDVHLLDAAIDVSPAARVEGRIERGVGREMARDAFAFFALLSLGVLVAVVLAAVLASLIVPDALVSTGRLMRAEPGRVAGAAALAWLAFPVLAVMLIPTVVGLPIGLGYLIFILPVLGFAGTIVSGTWLGGMLYRQVASREARPIAAAAIGVTLVVVLSRVPLLGLLATLVAMAGGGAILLAGSRAIRRNSLRD